MDHSPRVLLLDDGELDDVALHLDQLGVPFTRLTGGEIDGEQAPPLALLIATPRRASCVRRGSPAGARPGRPVRIIVVEEDSNAMRRMLRRMGFHLLVRRPTHPEVWRLLIQRALFQGEERRSELRVPIGHEVALHANDGSRPVVLVDLSTRGCRLLSDAPFPTDSAVSIEIPGRAMGDEPLSLSGALERAEDGGTVSGPERHAAAMLFDPDLDDNTRLRLSRWVGSWSNGALLPEAHGRSHDPAQLEKARQAEIADRRRHARGSFKEAIRAESAADSRVLMGRDLSAGGLSVERLEGLEVGDEFSLAIYGPSRPEPFTVSAMVIRDDGEHGLALAFQGLDSEVAAELEKLVACLPDVESLESGEADGLGSVITEIVQASDPH